MVKGVEMGNESSGLSGQQLAKINVQKFQDWIAERDSAGDWQDYIRGDKLNRSEIAAECGFALAVLRQNPAVKRVLDAQENRLRTDGILTNEKLSPLIFSESTDASSNAVDRRIMVARAQAEARVKTLEELNAALKAEVGDLREQLRRYKHLESQLCRTGRMIHP